MNPEGRPGTLWEPKVPSFLHGHPHPIPCTHPHVPLTSHPPQTHLNPSSQPLVTHTCLTTILQPWFAPPAGCNAMK